jgi:hypothetical protein
VEDYSQAKVLKGIGINCSNFSKWPYFRLEVWRMKPNAIELADMGPDGTLRLAGQVPRARCSSFPGCLLSHMPANHRQIAAEAIPTISSIFSSFISPFNIHSFQMAHIFEHSAEIGLDAQI